MRKRYDKATLSQYLDDLAARLPAPGGGSASALDAALGVALISMVVNFTNGKPKYLVFEKELTRILGESEKLRLRFLRLVDEDVQAYLSGNLRRSLAVPLEIARLSLKGISLCPRLVKIGNVNLISDVACAAFFLESAFKAAYFNVLVNLKLLKDKRLTERLNRQFKVNFKKIGNLTQKMEDEIGKIIRG